MKPKPTAKDRVLIRSCADRLWEWAEKIEDYDTKQWLKTISTDLHGACHEPRTKGNLK